MDQRRKPIEVALPLEAMAFRCGLIPTNATGSTCGVAVPMGIRADATSSQPSSLPNLAAELRASSASRVERVRALRGKYRGIAPTVDEYFAEKQLDSD